MYAFVIMMLSTTAPDTATATPVPPASAQEAPAYKKVCQDIELPTSRMPKRVCHKVAVKKSAPTDEQEANSKPNGATRETAGE